MGSITIMHVHVPILGVSSLDLGRSSSERPLFSRNFWKFGFVAAAQDRGDVYLIGVCLDFFNTS